jgi:hypothetical protein
VAILIISHSACFMLGGSLGFLLAAICAMASDKHSLSHSPDRYELRVPTTEDQPVSEQARLASLLH